MNAKNVKVVVPPGGCVTICFEDTDGEFEVIFDTGDFPDQLLIRETAGLPGNIKGQADEILYHERFSTCNKPLAKVTER